MPLKKRFTSIAALLALTLLLADANGNIAQSAALDDCQHAANLASIEKRLSIYTTMGTGKLNSDEQKWYNKFQKGGLFFDGWQDISQDVVAKVPEEEKVKTKLTMQVLGDKIGSEWCKKNEIRKISTDMLKQWGNQLRKAVASSSSQIAPVLHSIEYEVDELLSLN
ncbi:MAG: hypothetical protein KKD01_15245 [Proteobacteria bacterium]|nr:hypothetical protein [Pseudomonadota bacterium]MBU1420515.1 hypothetical protein [Pseudomonadota bacterium]MBU1456078.1 hypothetical protein [Pseudomonadota bacterium]